MVSKNSERLRFSHAAAKSFQIATVQNVNARCDQHRLMDGMSHSFDLRRRHVTAVIAPENGDVPLLKPGSTTGVQPRRKTCPHPRPLWLLGEPTVPCG